MENSKETNRGNNNERIFIIYEEEDRGEKFLEKYSYNELVLKFSTELNLATAKKYEGIIYAISHNLCDLSLTEDIVTVLKVRPSTPEEFLKTEQFYFLAEKCNMTRDMYESIKENPY